MIYERILSLIVNIRSAFGSISKLIGVVEDMKKHNTNDEKLYSKIVNGLRTIRKYEDKKSTLIRKTGKPKLIDLQREEVENIKLLETLIRRLEMEDFIEAKLTEKRINHIKKNIPRLLIKESAMLKG